jgi:tRNA-2-methylthio-N6-dimethylallyladenosine synthase
MFKYSPREGTPAAELEDDVPTRVKEERHQRLLHTQNGISLEIYGSLIGKEVEVLVEGPSRKNPSRLTGRTRDNKIAVFEGAQGLTGEIIRVRVKEANVHTLYCQQTDSYPEATI